MSEQALQPTLAALAEKAGVGEIYDITGQLTYGHAAAIIFPGADGTLTPAECWTVLGWLADAGYGFEKRPFSVDGNFHVFKILNHEDEPIATGIPMADNDTLAEALVAALLALPIDVKDGAG